MQGFIASLLVKFLSALVAKLMEYFKKQQEMKENDELLDEKLKNFKQSYKEAFDGTPVTPEQKEKLKSAISDFILR